MTVQVRTTGAAAVAQAAALGRLRADDVATRLAAGDPTLFVDGSEAATRLGWLHAVERSRPLLPGLLALRDALRAERVDRVVLCGMGGSSLAPEVICASAGRPLVVLDSTHPDQVRTALSGDLTRTVVVVSSKSGGTVETDSQRRAFAAAFEGAGVDAASRMVVVTDPGSPFASLAAELGYRAVFLADPTVGGRYSALTAFGLVPSALAGVDVEALLAEASAPGLIEVGVELGAALAGDPSRDKLAIDASGSTLVGFGDWTEQLVAESTGKLGRGLLPVVVDASAPEVRFPAPDVHVVRIGDAPAEGTGVTGPLGAQLVVWEVATAVAGHLLGLDPFDQPDVESAKVAARGLLEAQPEPAAPAFVDDGVEVHGTPGLLDGVTTVEGAVEALLGRLDDRGYLAVMAYLDRERDAALARVRGSLAQQCERPTTFGWGPRFLHSTGQFHKGGTPVGCFLQVTGLVTDDLEVPDRPFSFGTLLAAQAAGDATVLADKGRPVLRLHVTTSAGLERVVEALS
ncbi:MAG: glucose-6-phosphate isomerase [Mycobacteriales bacterium]|nr:glucose-6-phosphate isomerase [Mycobacteriales bacterium]